MKCSKINFFSRVTKPWVVTNYKQYGERSYCLGVIGFYDGFIRFKGNLTYYVH